MERLICFRTARLAVLAGLIVLFFTSSSQAGFSMRLAATGTGGVDADGFVVSESKIPTTTVSLTSQVALGGGWYLGLLGGETASQVNVTSFNGNQISVKATIDGYTFGVTANSNQDQSSGSLARVSMSTTVTSSGTVPGKDFQYDVSDSPFEFPGTAKSTVYLTASAITSNQFDNGGVGPGKNSVSTVGAYSNGSLHLTKQDKLLTGTFQTRTTNTVSIAPRGTTFALTDLGGTIILGGKAGKNNFYTQSVVSLPEPTGIIIGLLALPCFAGLVVLARHSRKVAVA
jgi:hypothetical protein